MKLNNRKNKNAVFNRSEFDYTEYLRDYYNNMASGLEKVPSAKEVNFFFQELFSTMSSNLSHKIAEEEESVELEFKQKMVA